MLASTWTDMVMGVDIHFEMVPTPAGPIPTPFPNPFVGVVLDPIGLAIGLAIGAGISAAFGGPITGPVNMYTAFFATNVGTEAKGMGHILIPPGTMWVPMPKFPKPSFKGPPDFPGLPVKPEDDAVAIMGSKTVQVMGASQVRMGEMWMSCGEPLRAPSSVVIAIPKGGPILVGGPPAVDLLTALTSMIKTKWVAGYLHSLLDKLKPGRLRNVLHWAACQLTGHPVDVATGRVITDHVDWELPGPLPLKFERVYFSSWSDRSGPLGHGWSHSLDEALWSERGKIVYMTGDGREIEFDTFDFPDHKLPPGTPLFEPISRLTLVLDGRGGATVTTHDGVRREFLPIPGTSGVRQNWLRLKRIADRAGNTIDIDYDKRGNIEWIRDCCGRQVCFEYDAHNRLTLVKLPHPTERAWLPHTRYSYDDNGDLVQITDPMGHSWRFEYKNHLLVRETDRNGLSFYFAYDGFTQDACCVRTWGDGGIYDHVLDYDKKGKVTYVSNSLGQKTTYHMNEIGLVTKVVDPLGTETAYEYHEPSLQKSKETDALGQEQQWFYDSRGNCIKTVTANGTATSFVYDEANLLTRVDQGPDKTWQYQYDKAGRLLERRGPDRFLEHLSWQGGSLIRIVREGGKQQRIQYDDQKNAIRRDCGENSVSFRYDLLGRVVETRENDSRPVRYEWDSCGRIRRQISPTGLMLDILYDAEGHILRHTTPNSDLRFEYGCRDRITCRREREAMTRFTYDTEGRLKKVENAAGEAHSVELDASGQLIAETGFDGSARRYQRDPLGRATKVDLPGGGSAKYTYDAEDNVTKVEHSDGTWTKYEYAPDGQLIAAENQNGRVAFEWDAETRVFREVQSGPKGEWSIRSGLDADGQRAWLETSLGSRVDIARDQRGLTTEMRLGANRPTVPHAKIAVTNDGFGSLIQLDRPGGLQSSWSYDDEGRPVERRTQGAHGAATLRRFHWRGEDQIAAIETEAVQTQLEHDGLGRLTASMTPGTRPTVRSFDLAGNVYTTDARQERSYAPGGRIVQAEGTTYEHDPDGFLTKKTTSDGRSWSYAWNAAGTLAEVQSPDGSTTKFLYDALGRRISKQCVRHDSGGVEQVVEERRFVWDGHLLVHELSSNTGLTSWYWQPDTYVPLAKEHEERRWFIDTDQLGTPTEMYDSEGNLVWQMELDVHGHASFPRGESTFCPFRRPGQYADDETGLYANGFRYYSPEQGSYISPDPLGLRTDQPPYGYAADPYWAIDPLGLARPGSYWHDAGVWITSGGNPQFPSAHNVRLPPAMRAATVSDGRQMRYATRNLRDAIDAGTVDASNFTRRQLKAIRKGLDRIPGYTWHHHPNGSLMQLVDRKLHNAVGHDGGRKKVGGRC